MNYLNKQQKDKVQYLKSVLGTDETVTIEYLKKSGWDVDKACDTYFSSTQAKDTTKVKATKKLETTFNTYKEEGDKIGIEGLTKLLSDLGVDPLDPVTLVMSYYFGAKTMGEYTKEEFFSGMTKLRCETIKDLQGQLKGLKQQFKDDANLFKEVYKFTFNFAKDTGKRSLDFDNAKALWEILLVNKFPFLAEWLEYLDSLKEKNDVSKDTWNMLYEFHQTTNGDISKYVDDGAWPVIVDEFVDWLKTKRGM